MILENDVHWWVSVLAALSRRQPLRPAPISLCLSSEQHGRHDEVNLASPRTRGEARVTHTDKS